MMLRKERSDKGRLRGSSKTQPDRVFTFRLSPDNPIENQVIQALDAEFQRDVPLRDTICNAIRRYQPVDSQPEPEAAGLSGLLDSLHSAIDRLLSAEIVPGKKPPKTKQGQFNASYLQNLKKAINAEDK